MVINFSACFRSMNPKISSAEFKTSASFSYTNNPPHPQFSPNKKRKRPRTGQLVFNKTLDTPTDHVTHIKIIIHIHAPAVQTQMSPWHLNANERKLSHARTCEI